MDALYFKAERLKSLWEEYRQTNQCSVADYGDHSAWAREQLQLALTELDILIGKQLEWKERLAADIEDLLQEIEEKARIFGRPVDLLIPEAAGLYFPITTSKKESLQAILNELNEEIEVTRSNLETWLAGISLYSMELNAKIVVPSKEVFKNDLSGARILPIQWQYDTLYRTVITLRDTFEDTSKRLHFFWKAYEYGPVDDLDKALEQLFKNKPEPKDIFDNSNNNDNNSNSKTGDVGVIEIAGVDALAGVVNEDFDLGTEKRREHTYYSFPLPRGLSLSVDVIEALKVKADTFAAEYEERRGRRDKMQKVITELWEELSIPLDDRQVEIKESVDEAYLEELSAEHQRLRAIMREIVQKAIDKHTAQLEELWDKCLVPQNERLGFIAALHEISSTDEVYETLAAEVARLTELYTKCAKIYRLMLERRALIEKMKEFEKTASDPRRLFQNSKRLLEEEKWRKNAWPNLVKLEDKLIAACLEYEENERKPFLHESTRYLDTLQTEISERVVNQMFFGFEQNAKEKQANKGPPGSGPPRQRRESAVEAIPPRSRRDSKVSVASSRSVSPVSRPLTPTSRSNTGGTRHVTPHADSRRRSMYLEPTAASSRRTPSPSRSNSTTHLTPSSAKRSGSPSSNSSSSSVSSVPSPTTPEPSNRTSSQRNGGGATKTKDVPTKRATAPTTTRRLTTGSPRPRPKSTVLPDTANGSSSIPKKLASKRMSVVVESGGRL